MKLKRLINSKKGLSILSTGILVVAAGITSRAVVVTNHQSVADSKNYAFDGQTFNNKNQIYQYVKNKTDVENYTFNQNDYYYDNHIFSSQLDMQSYIRDKYHCRINSQI